MRSEDGSMAVAMSSLTAIVAVLSVAVASVATLYAARTQAANAADAAALAAAVATYPAASATDPAVAAQAAATANGAVVIGCRCPRDTGLRARVVEVVTAVEASVPIFGTVTVRAAGRAEFDPRRWLGR